MLPDPKVLIDPVEPDKAIEFWQEKASMPRAEAEKLAEGARWRAFYVSGLMRRDVIDTVKNALGEAIKNGETLADFKKRIPELIDKAGWKSWRAENIFRTNIQTAYAAGRYAKMQAVAKERPYWQYLTIEDKRRRPAHAVLQGMIWPADHEFWDEHYPPNGFRCRCTVRTLSERQLGDKEVQIKMPYDLLYKDPKTGMEYHVAMPGADAKFRNNPGKDWLAGLDPKVVPAAAARGKDKASKAITGKPKVVPTASAQPSLKAQEVKNYAQLSRDIRDKCSHFAENAGIKTVNMVKGRNYLMQTDCRGEFWINNATSSRHDNFNAAVDLKSAWNKLATGKDLTFNEEYSLESLWHEIVHNKQHFKRRRVAEETNVLETVTQWTARRTYPELIESLGGKAKHQAEIIKGGYGYAQRLYNFDKLLKHTGVDEKKLLPKMQQLIKDKPGEEYWEELSKILASSGAETDSVKLKDILKKIALHTDKFEGRLSSIKGVKPAS